MKDGVNNKAVIKVILVCLAVLLTSGCINYEQETYLNEDMSGRIEIHLFANPRPAFETVFKKMGEKSKLQLNMEKALSEAAYKMDMNIKEEDILKGFNQEAIKNKSFKKIRTDGITHFYLTIEFDDIRKLFEGKKKIGITEGKDGLITYNEYFEPTNGEGRNTDSECNDDNEIFKSFSFKYTLHLPSDIMSANTGNIKRDTAIWEFPLSSVMKDKDFKVTATFKGEDKLSRWLKRFGKQQ